jgi:predicted phage terminase large subunit-like protein
MNFTRAQVDRARVAKLGLYQFVRISWSVVCTDPFVPGKHLEIICSKLQECARRDIRKLAICIPPAHSKSLITSVFFPAWLWATQDPTESFLCTSYSEKVAHHHARLMMRLVNSDWYRERFGNIRIGEDGGKGVGFFENNRRGYRISTSMGGQVTGRHAGILITDDPLSAGDARDDSAVMAEAVDFFTRVIPSRASDPETAVQILIGQRLHPGDPAGHALANSDWSSLVLPARFDPTRADPADWRTEAGEVLWPERLPAHVVDALQRSMAPSHWQSQYLQNPLPEGGNIFKKDWLRYWSLDGLIPGTTKLPHVSTKIVSVDPNLKEGKDSDFFCAQVWSRVGADFYLLDQEHHRCGFSEGLEHLKRLRARSRATTVLVESSANGPAIESSLRRAGVPGVVLVKANRSKVERAEVVSPLFMAGNVYLPHSSIAPFVPDLVAELLGFPKVPHDDRTDSLTMALAHLLERGGNRLVDAMRMMRADPSLQTLLTGGQPWWEKYR